MRDKQLLLRNWDVDSAWLACFPFVNKNLWIWILKNDQIWEANQIFWWDFCVLVTDFWLILTPLIFYHFNFIFCKATKIRAKLCKRIVADFSCPLCQCSKFSPKVEELMSKSSDKKKSCSYFFRVVTFEKAKWSLT